MSEILAVSENEAGRPPIPVDLELLGDLAEIHCVQAEAAPILGISLRTFERHLAEDDEFAAVWYGRAARGKKSLRRLQWEQAEAGNVTMQIWLGKQLLGQKDRQELTGKDDAPIFGDITYQIGGVEIASEGKANGNGAGEREASLTSGSGEGGS